MRHGIFRLGAVDRVAVRTALLHELGTPVPGRQAAIRRCEGSLSWFRQEHRADRDVVCADQPVAGAQTLVAFDGRGTPV